MENILRFQVDQISQNCQKSAILDQKLIPFHEFLQIGDFSDFMKYGKITPDVCRNRPHRSCFWANFLSLLMLKHSVSFYLFHSKKPLYFPTICSEYIIHFDSLKLSNMKIRIKNIKLRQECKFAENGTKVWNYSKSR